MVFVGVIPYSVGKDGVIRYLLGMEATEDNFKDSGKWSAFGGRLEETDNSIYEGIARECYEESLGFLGDQYSILKSIVSKPVYKLKDGSKVTYETIPAEITGREVINNKWYVPENTSFTSVLEIPYSDTLPDLYINVYDYVRNSLNSSATRRHPYKIKTQNILDGYYEKVEIDWFTKEDIMSERVMMRPSFYNSIIEIWNVGLGPLSKNPTE